ncbi:MAG: acyl carrier protein [Planctomycetota bacterium]
MSKDEFRREFASQLQVDESALSSETALADVEGWDSMTAMEYIALADELCSVQVTGAQLAECETVGDLLAVLPLDE